MDENCGPEHLDCDCEYACPACAGKVEGDNHVCDCRHCDHESEIEYACVACMWVGDQFEVTEITEAQKHREETKLAEWKAWAS